MEKQPISSNLQGLENETPLPQGEPNERINYASDQQFIPAEYHSTGEIIKEKSDIYRLEDEDFRLRVKKIELGDNSKTDQEYEITTFEYDPVVHSDSKSGRLHLSIRYDDERSQLIIQIINAQGIIRPEQIYGPDMCLTFSLIKNDTNNQSQIEKHERIIVNNISIQWKEPIIFCITYQNALQQNLHISVSNRTDPSAPRDREVLIPLNNLKLHNEEINNWFNLQFVKSV